MFRTSISSGQWDRCHTVASTELSRSDPRFLDLFPEIWVRQRVRKKRTVLSKDVISSRPRLDMYHDDTVYMTSKLFSFHELNGWLFAVDTKARKLEKVVPFSEERTSSGNTKLQCAFSKYLNKEGNFNICSPTAHLFVGKYMSWLAKSRTWLMQEETCLHRT